MATLGLTFNQTTTADHPTASSIVPIVHRGRTSRKRWVSIGSPSSAASASSVKQFKDQSHETTDKTAKECTGCECMGDFRDSVINHVLKR